MIEPVAILLSIAITAIGMSALSMLAAALYYRWDKYELYGSAWWEVSWRMLLLVAGITVFVTTAVFVKDWLMGL